MLDDETEETRSPSSPISSWCGYWRAGLRSAGAKSRSRGRPVAYVQRKHTYAGVHVRARPERETRDIPLFHPPPRKLLCSKSPIDISRLSIGELPGVNSGGHGPENKRERQPKRRLTSLSFYLSLFLPTCAEKPFCLDGIFIKKSREISGLL